MKRLVAVLILIVCLSFPCFAGHGQIGGGYCDCGTEECICDPGERPVRQPANDHEKDAPRDATSELAIAIVALLLWLRIKAQ
jgi:hypothetical protein